MKKVLKILEFDKILEKMQEYTQSEYVKKRILRLEPFKSMDDVRQAQKETTEAMSTLLKLGNIPVNLAVSDVRGSVKRAEQGGVLSPKELMDISRVLYVARRTKAYLSETSEECTILHDMENRLLTAKALEDKINSSVISEEEIADDASQELSAIRRKMKNLNGKMYTFAAVMGMLSGLSFSKAFYHKGKIDGMRRAETIMYKSLLEALFESEMKKAEAKESD